MTKLKKNPVKPADYWTYKAPPTPTLAEAIAAGRIGKDTTETQWNRLSPGMKREILRKNPMAKKRKAAGGKKSGAKATSARRAVNIKVNVVSKNPRRKRKPAKRQVAKRTPARRIAKRSTSKRKVSRFVICARTRGGKSFYETRARKFIADRKQARLFPSQAAASKEAHRMLSKMPATVKTLAVERA